MMASRIALTAPMNPTARTSAKSRYVVQAQGQDLWSEVASFGGHLEELHNSPKFLTFVQNLSISF